MNPDAPAVLRCPVCRYPIWTTDEGARCTDEDYVTGERRDNRSCGAVWGCTGRLETNLPIIRCQPIQR